MPTQRPAPFLTLEDPNAKIKGSRDPLGVYRRTFGPLVRGPSLDFKDGDTTVRIPISRTAHLLLPSRSACPHRYERRPRRTSP